MVAQGKADSPIRAVTLRDMLLDPYTVSGGYSISIVAPISGRVSTIFKCTMCS